MGFMLSDLEKARRFPLGFLLATKIECEENFRWLKFSIAKNLLTAKGELSKNGRNYNFEIAYSPFFLGRFDRVKVKGKDLIQCADTHFNGDKTLCLYHPVHDLRGRLFMPLVKIIPFISEWVYYYDKYRKYSVWVGPEYPHRLK
jgi:hypothetical protein